jgi:NADH dehydrogenase
MKSPANTQIAITGAFSYSGRYIAKRLLAKGCQLRTLTGNPSRPNPFDASVPAYPFNFRQPDKLAESLSGVDVLVSTYWVRFDHGQSTFLRAVSNVRRLFWAAKQAGVRRVVHISITNPDPFTDLPYFWGKAVLEEELKASGISYAILRPTVIFGKEDILINNIAWFLRRFPLFTVPGDGEYRLQPIFVEDLAKLAVEQVFKEENVIIDAIGPETFTFNQLVHLLRETVGSRALLVNAPPMVAQKLSSIVGKVVKDVILTKDEVDGLLGDYLVTDSPPAGDTALSVWVRENKDTLGKHYAHEIERHY